MLRDFVLETCNAPGTATTVTLAGAPTGRMSFAQAFPSGSLCFYYMDDGTQAEWGVGTFTAGTPNTFARPSSPNNTAGTSAKLNFAGTTRIYNEVPASHAVYTDNLGAIRPNANFSVDASGNIIAAGTASIAGSLTCGGGGSFQASTAASGYQKLPSGLIKQWGTSTTVAGGGVGVGFTIAFPSAVRSVQVTICNVGGPAAETIACGTPALTGVNVWAANSSTGAGIAGVPFFWEAIGL